MMVEVLHKVQGKAAMLIAFLSSISSLGILLPLSASASDTTAWSLMLLQLSLTGLPVLSSLSKKAEL